VVHNAAFATDGVEGITEADAKRRGELRSAATRALVEVTSLDHQCFALQKNVVSRGPADFVALLGKRLRKAESAPDGSQYEAIPQALWLQGQWPLDEAGDWSSANDLYIDFAAKADAGELQSTWLRVRDLARIIHGVEVVSK
jgi:hypothetical protein